MQGLFVVFLLLVAVVDAGIPGIAAGASSEIQKQVEDEAKTYLCKFGYFSAPKEKQIKGAANGPSKQELQDAVKKFQRSFLMFTSGDVDVPTQSKMNEFRCANRDLIRGYPLRDLPKKELWQKKVLLWNVTSRPASLSDSQVREACDEAFEKWRGATDFTFLETNDATKADVVISFEDVPSNFLNIAASASKPTKSRIILDKNRVWAYRDHILRGISLFHTLLHEVGHVLGLHHNFYRGPQLPPLTGNDYNFSIMYPVFKPALLPFGLLDGIPNVDKLAIHKLYGFSQTELLSTEDQTTTQPSRCPRFIDSLVAANNEDWFLFRENKVWTVKNKKFVDDGHLIQTVFPRGPQFVNATVSSNGLILLFVERTIYGYDFDGVSFTEAQGYPKELHDRVLFYPQGAFPLNNGSVVLLSGNVFATYDVSQNAPSFLNDKQRYFPNLPEDLKSGVQKRVGADDAYWMMDEATVSDYDMVTKQVLQLQNIASFLKCE